MKRILLVLVLASIALSGCAQLSADAGATAPEEQGPFPKQRYQPNFQSW